MKPRNQSLFAQVLVTPGDPSPEDRDLIQIVAHKLDQLIDAARAQGLADARAADAGSAAANSAARDALKDISSQADNQDLNHADFRIGAKIVAETVLADDGDDQGSAGL